MLDTMNNSDDGPLIAVLSKLSAADVGLVGGKAANLGELTQHGFPVPGGFVLTAIAHRLFVTTSAWPITLLHTTLPI